MKNTRERSSTIDQMTYGAHKEKTLRLDLLRNTVEVVTGLRLTREARRRNSLVMRREK